MIQLILVGVNLMTKSSIQLLPYNFSALNPNSRRIPIIKGIASEDKDDGPGPGFDGDMSTQAYAKDRNNVVWIKYRFARPYFVDYITIYYEFRKYWYGYCLIDCVTLKHANYNVDIRKNGQPVKRCGHLVAKEVDHKINNIYTFPCGAVADEIFLSKEDNNDLALCEIVATTIKVTPPGKDLHTILLLSAKITIRWMKVYALLESSE